jgi:hypothetical protein
MLKSTSRLPQNIPSKPQLVKIREKLLSAGAINDGRLVLVGGGWRATKQKASPPRHWDPQTRTPSTQSRHHSLTP